MPAMPAYREQPPGSMFCLVRSIPCRVLPWHACGRRRPQRSAHGGTMCSIAGALRSHARSSRMGAMARRCKLRAHVATRPMHGALASVHAARRSSVAHAHRILCMHLQRGAMHSPRRRLVGFHGAAGLSQYLMPEGTTFLHTLLFCEPHTQLSNWNPALTTLTNGGYGDLRRLWAANRLVISFIPTENASAAARGLKKV